MGGAGRIIAEAGAVNFFYENTTNGTFNLSPLGEVAMGFSRFAHAAGSAPAALEAWRGIAYVPVALLVELAHGMGESSLISVCLSVADSRCADRLGIFLQWSGMGRVPFERRRESHAGVVSSPLA